MLRTFEATLLPSGLVTFSEPLPVDHPTPVLITLLEGVSEPAGASLPKAEPAVEEPPPRTALWKRLMALREAAGNEGMPLLTQDQILEEMRRRRGELSDE